MIPVAGILRGVAAILLAQLALLLNDTLVKLTSATLPMGEIIFFRGFFATILIGGLVVGTGVHRSLPLLADSLVAWRVVGELGGTLFFIVALIHMPIAVVTIIFQAMPLSVTAGAALFLGEAVGWRRWLAIGIGFAGVVVIVRPGLSGFDAYGLLVLVSVLFVSMRDLTTRALSPAVPTLLLSFATAATVAVMGAGFAAIEDWHLPSAVDFSRLGGAALFLSIGYVAIIAAMRLGEMSVTASFRYAAIVFAIASGYLVWGDIPDALTILGSLVIVVAGLYTLYREHALARGGQPLIAAPAAIDPPTGG